MNKRPKVKTMGKVKKVGLIDLLPSDQAERIIDTEKFNDAMDTANWYLDYDPNSYQKAIKRSAIRQFQLNRGSK